MSNFKQDLSDHELLNDDLDLSEFDDELNDETFGAPIQDDWEATHEELAFSEEKKLIKDVLNIKKVNLNNSINDVSNCDLQQDLENEKDNVLINNTLNQVAYHHFNQLQQNLMQRMRLNLQQLNLHELQQEQLQYQLNLDNNLQPKQFVTYNPQHLIDDQTSTNINNNTTDYINDDFAAINLNSNESKNVNLEEEKIFNNKKALTLEELEQSLINESEKKSFQSTLHEENGLLFKPQHIEDVKDLEMGFIMHVYNRFYDKININKNQNIKDNQINFNNNTNDLNNKKISNDLPTNNNNNNNNNNNKNQNHYFQRKNTSFSRNNNQPLLIPNPFNPSEMIRTESNYKYQVQKNDHSNKQNYHKKKYNQYENRNDLVQNENYDEYAGLMTRKDINRLKKIQEIQLEFEDPYVQDYYFVNYQTRKIAAELKKRDKMNGKNHSIPTLVIPERFSKSQTNENDNYSTESSKYVPPNFSGSLGKIQSYNPNYPRRLLDFNNKLEKLTKKSQNSNVEPQGRTELNKFRKILLDIEQNILIVLKIDHEDKKIAALPTNAQVNHLQERKLLCEELFNGILTTKDHKNINFKIANVRKGCMLIFKALQVLQDPYMKTIIISDLLKVDNFHYVVMQKDKTLYCLDYGEVLSDTIKTIKDCSFNYLLQIAEALDDPSFVAKFQCGQEIIEVILEQCKYFNIKNDDQKHQWLSFLERVLEDVDDIPHLRKLCNDHIFAITN